MFDSDLRKFDLTFPAFELEGVWIFINIPSTHPRQPSITPVLLINLKAIDAALSSASVDGKAKATCGQSRMASMQRCTII
jgi:hypothetical protein